MRNCGDVEYVEMVCGACVCVCVLDKVVEEFRRKVVCSNQVLELIVSLESDRFHSERCHSNRMVSVFLIYCVRVSYVIIIFIYD